MKKFFGRASGDKDKDKPKPLKAREHTPEATGRAIDGGANAPIYQQFHTTPPTLPAGSPTGPQPVQRSASSGLDSAEYSGEERWEYLAAQEQRAPTELPEPPRMLAPGHSHSHSHSQSQPASDMHPPRPESPYSVASSYTPSVQPHGAPPSSRKVKKPPPPAASTVATTLGLLNALAPQGVPQPSPPSMAHQQSWVDEGPDPHSHQEERRDKRPGFWSRDTDRNKERDKGKSRDANDPADLIRMIGYLVATNAEDWTFVLEVCERTNLNENNCKEASRALRREFKYSDPSAQLSAAKLWAIMLNNCNENFAVQCGARKFLDVIEEVITSSQTPVVRDRLLEVLAGATYASLQRRRDGKKHEKDGYQALWRKVKLPGKPDSGIPFDTEDAMFNPPTPRRMSAQVAPAHAPPLEPLRSPAHQDDTWPPSDPRHKPAPPKAKHAPHPSKNRVIPVEEDIRRLFQECKVGRGNASVLVQNLTYAKPQDLEKEINQEFFFKCHASQDFIATQIPWATAGADRSREQHMIQISMLPEHEQAARAAELTIEEQLLADLLGANEDLLDALRIYDDLKRIGIERQAEALSRQETRMPRSQVPYLDANGSAASYDTAGSGGSHQGSANGSYLVLPATNGGGDGSSRSSSPPSPSSSPAGSAPSAAHHTHSGSVHSGHGPLPRPPVASSVPHSQAMPGTPPMQHSLPPSLLVGSLAPPTRFGPRSPALVALANRSRTPSPERAGRAMLPPSLTPGKAPLPAPPHPAFALAPRRPGPADGTVDAAANALRRLDMSAYQRKSIESDDAPTPVKVSAKALGKRRAAPPSPTEGRFDPDDPYHDSSDPLENNEWRNDDDDDPHRPRPPPTQYVYDAVAERHEQLVREGRHLAALADLATGR